MCARTGNKYFFALPRRFVLIALALLLLPLPLAASDSILERWPEGGHIRIQDPRDLAPADAENIYDALLERMIFGYAKSGLANTDYRAWQRLNTSPYISDQHGARFMNVYINDKAGDFFTASAAQPMVVGSVVIKDSISAVESGGISGGPLFIMEKMPAGFAPEFSDWRYTMIMPNGKLFGMTSGAGNRAVKFCAECHLQVAERDHLFELPEKYLRPQN
jgi:hypothetical protein